MPKREEFSKPVQGQIVERSKNEDGQICCERCGLILGSKKFQIDHKVAEGIRTAESRKKKLTAKDGQLLCIPCHIEKTGEDKELMRKPNAARKRANGLAKSSKSIPSRGFGKSDKPKSNAVQAGLKTLPPKQLYGART